MAYGKGGGTGSGSSVSKESAARGQTIINSTGPMREKTGEEFSEAFKGKEMKDTGLDHSIKNGKVPAGN